MDAPRKELPAVIVAAGLIHGLIDLDSPAIDRLAVEPVDGGPGLILGTHLHEPEALGLAGIAIGDDLGGDDGSVILEGGAEAVLVRAVTQIPYVKLLSHVTLPSTALRPAG